MLDPHRQLLLKPRSALQGFARLLLCPLLAAAILTAVPTADAKDKAGGNGKGQSENGSRHGGKHAKKGGKGKKGGNKSEDRNVIRPDVLSRLMAANPGLQKNFLTQDTPDRKIKLPDGRTVPIYKLQQFLEANFRLTFFARKKEKGSDVVATSEEHLRKLLATPLFYERVLNHKPKYKIGGKGTVSAREAYNYIRHIHRNLGVTADKKVKAPVGGGSGINAPSWAVWKAMNLFWHEACHCIGIGHNSGGLSGPIAGSMRQWDRQKKWKYETIDVNRL